MKSNSKEFRGMNVGRPRSTKKKKGNAASKTSRRGNGKKLGSLDRPWLSWIEQRTSIPQVAGSSPAAHVPSEGSVSRVTQLVEWVAVNHQVAGSSPAAGVHF